MVELTGVMEVKSGNCTVIYYIEKSCICGGADWTCHSILVLRNVP